MFSNKWLLGFGGVCLASLLLLLVDYDSKIEAYIARAASAKFEEFTSLSVQNNENLPNHAKHCVTVYDLFDKYMATEKGKSFYKSTKTNITLVGAYAYSNYSVVTLEADGWYGRKVYCHYLDANYNELGVPVESVVFPEFSVYCCRHPQAFYMGITESKNDIMPTTPVLDRTVDKPKYNLSLCLATIYGNESKWLLLTELIEHYKLQGVQHFYVYIRNVDEYSRLLFNDYEKSGEIEIVHFKQEQDRDGLDWQFVSIMDCLHRSRHHSRYTIQSDLDERILTLGNQSLAEYISKAMTSGPNIGMLQFQMSWIIRTTKPPDEYEGKLTLKNHLPTLVFHNTSAVLPWRRGTPKCVLDPLLVVFMGVHDVFLYFPGYERARAPPDEALIRHYRDLYDNLRKPGQPSVLSRLEEIGKLGNFTLTHYPEHLMRKLYNNVQNRLSRVFKKSILS